MVGLISHINKSETMENFLLAKDEVVPTEGHLAVLGDKYTALEHRLICGYSAEVSTEDGVEGQYRTKFGRRQIKSASPTCGKVPPSQTIKRIVTRQGLSSLKKRNQAP